MIAHVPALGLSRFAKADFGSRSVRDTPRPVAFTEVDGWVAETGRAAGRRSFQGGVGHADTAVTSTDGADERVEAGMLATESGALVALSPEGLILRAWAPGQWLTVRHVEGADPELLVAGVEELNGVSALSRS